MLDQSVDDIPDSYIKSSSNSLPVFFGTLSSSSTLNKESYDRAAFSCALAFASSASCCFYYKERRGKFFKFVSNKKEFSKFGYLLSNSCSFDSIFSFDTVDTLLLVVHFTFNFCFVKAVDNSIFTTGNMY